MVIIFNSGANGRLTNFMTDSGETNDLAGHSEETFLAADLTTDSA